MEKEEKNAEESVVGLTRIIKQFLSERYLRILDNPKKFLFYNFLTGLVSGIGYALGATLVFALIIWLLSKLTLIPLLGNFISNILDYIQKSRLQ